jgi:hypothetical protein
VVSIFLRQAVVAIGEGSCMLEFLSQGPLVLVG